MRWFSWYLFGTVHCIQKCYWLLCVDFCIFQGPNLLVLNNVLVESLWFSIYKIMPSANKRFNFFPSDLDAFLSFSCLTVLARTSSATVNRGHECWYSCFVCDLGGKAFNFRQHDLACGFGVHEFYCAERHSLPNLLLLF